MVDVVAVFVTLNNNCVSEGAFHDADSSTAFAGHNAESLLVHSRSPAPAPRTAHEQQQRQHGEKHRA